MAQTAPPVSFQPSKIKSVKALAESPGFNSLPPAYIVTTNPDDYVSSGPASDLPAIDYSLLVSDNPDQRSKAIDELAKACKEWGLFMLVNHGVEKRMASMIDAFREFFNQPMEVKQEYEGKNVLDPIRFGTSFNSSVDKALFWKDYLKIHLHPAFYSPSKPAGFRETLSAYYKGVNEVVSELFKVVSLSLGQEEDFIYKRMNLEQRFQLIAASYYPPCPQPELAMGMPPHSDQGLLTLLVTDGTSGLQLQREGKWFDVNDIPYCFLVNVGDHLEILTNGRYKSNVHRVVVNSKTPRISMAIANSPELDTVVSPAPELLQGGESNEPLYVGMKYKEYLRLNQSNNLDQKCCLDRVRIRV